MVRPGALCRGMAVALLLTGLVGVCAHAHDDEPLPLRDVLWQWLPEDVESVEVGPDDRLWLVLASPYPWHTIDSAKAAIVEAFAKPTPRLAGIRPVLFEPGPRIWFRVDPGWILLGFDGTTWIENVLPQRSTFKGSCLMVGDHRFFPAWHSVHVFDGTAWTLQALADEREPAPIPWQIMPTMEGDNVIAFNREPKARLWRWHDGTWSEVPLDVPNVIAACPGPDRSVWLFQAGENIVKRSDDTANSVADRTEAGIQTLRAAKTADEREAAIAALMELGPLALPFTEKALETSYDPDVLAGLIAAIKGMKQGGVTRVGNLTMNRPRSVVYDHARRRMVFFASRLRRGDQHVGDGLVVVSGDGATAHAFSHELWNRFPTSSVHAAFTADGKSAWISGSSGHWPARLIDIDAATVRLTAPDRQFASVQAVRSDGTVFLSTTHPAKSVAALRPDRPDDRRFLEIETLPLGRDSPALLGCDANGGVWVHLADQGLVRLHGDRKETIEKPIANQYERFGSMLAGGRGDVLLFSVHRSGYWRDGTLSVANDLQKLIADHRDTIADSFGAGQLPPAREVSRDIAVDAQKNIWLRANQRAAPVVLVGDKWLSAGTALTEAGARLPQVQYLAAAGGDWVYVSDLGMAHDGGRSFFGRLLDGTPTFQEAPHTSENWRIRPQVRDHEGGLWIPSSVRRGMGTSDNIGDQLALRIADGKVESTLTNAGWPAICDPAGVVWLDKVHGQPHGTVNFWWKGAIAGTVQIPGLLSTGSAGNIPALYADRPGSGVAWTNRGLVHLVAPPDKPAAFRIAATYSFAVDAGTFNPVVCSKEGLLVGYLSHHQRGSSLGVIRVPRPGPPDDHDRE
jgi:hypothetical protein